MQSLLERSALFWGSGFVLAAGALYATPAVLHLMFPHMAQAAGHESLRAACPVDAAGPATARRPPAASCPAPH